MMPMPLTVSCFSKIQIGFTFPDKDKAPLNGCVCVCVVCRRCGIIVSKCSVVWLWCAWSLDERWHWWATTDYEAACTVVWLASYVAATWRRCCAQLRDAKVRALAELLEKSNSSYFSYFRTIFQDVVAGTTMSAAWLYTHTR